MIKAIAIDSKGNEIGFPRMFPEIQWNSMVRANGKRLGWKLIEGKPEISKEEIDKIWKEEDSDKIWGKGDFKPIFKEKKEELEELTKHELIEKYNLSEDFMKSTKAEIIIFIEETFFINNE